MIFEIEKNIPIPAKVYRGRMTHGSVRYPWDEMEVHDSFALPIQYVNKVRVAAGARNVQGEQYFTVRETLEGHRCWRIR